MAFAVTAIVAGGASLAGVGALGALAIGAGVGLLNNQMQGQKKALSDQRNALNAAQAADRKDKADAVTGAQTAANELVAADRRRKRANTLALGDPSGTDQTLGVPSVLGAGSTTQLASKPASTVLGSAGA